MSEHSAIGWTNSTWNPVAGCTRVSEECDNCYAAWLVAHRLRNHPVYKGLAVVTKSGRAAFNGKIRELPDRLDKPLRWRTPRRVFVNSMSDLFHENLSDDFINSVYSTMALAKLHTFQVLTKRPERMAVFLRGPFYQNSWDIPRDPLAHVWHGTSVGTQRAVDERTRHLQDTDSVVRFLSCEPLLEPLTLDLRGIHWVIIGGESGPGRRPVGIGWIESIVAQCDAAGVKPFVKQDNGPRSEMRGRIPDHLWARKEYPVRVGGTSVGSEPGRPKKQGVVGTGGRWDMTDLRDAVQALAEAVMLLTNDDALIGLDRTRINELARRARDIAATVNGVAGQSGDV